MCAVGRLSEGEEFIGWSAFAAREHLLDLELSAPHKRGMRKMQLKCFHGATRTPHACALRPPVSLQSFRFGTTAMRHNSVETTNLRECGQLSSKVGYK